MNKHLPREDSKPWYQQFWPWFLIALPAIVVIAGVNMVFIASEGADDLVVDEYYKNGLAINRKLEKLERAEQLGIAAVLSIDGSDIIVSTSGPVEASRLELALSHPLESDRDFDIFLVQSVPGEYRGSLPATVAPRWHWALQLPGENGWRLDGSITGANFASSGD
jgi:uncharacterized protein